MILDYLYYKLYKGALKSSVSDIPNFAASVWFSVLVGTNLMMLNALLAKFDILPFIPKSPIQGGLFIMVILFFTIILYSNNRRDSVIKKYSNESEKDRKRGNIFLVLYVIVSFIIFIAVAFFRPGKL